MKKNDDIVLLAILFWAILIALVITVYGCEKQEVQRYRVHPEYNERIDSTRRPPTVDSLKRMRAKEYHPTKTPRKCEYKN